MTTRTPNRRPSMEAPDLDRAIEVAERDAIVVWRGERIAFLALPERIARTDGRHQRDGLFAGWVEAVDALNPLYEQRAARWGHAGREAGYDGALDGALAPDGIDAAALAAELETFSILSETAYHAALRRYLALIGIEHGDATEGDLWHIEDGATWNHWFGSRELRRAVAAAGRPVAEDEPDARGWRLGRALLAGADHGAHPTVARAIGLLHASLVGMPDWLDGELGMAAEEVTPFADFAAFVRLGAIRRQLGYLQYELRLWERDDPAIARAYYSGIVGHIIGAEVPEAGYLCAVTAPGASARQLRAAMLAGMLGETLAHRYAAAWWRDPAAAELVEEIRSAATVDDAVALLGYDVLDWSPALRQIRTQLIGEMSGYGGPNITTRAGTRKV
ncbi:MAG: hypothetical protein ACRDGD_01415 [Candidatus Limnocylindria bacterium]